MFALTLLNSFYFELIRTHIVSKTIMLTIFQISRLLSSMSPKHSEFWKILYSSIFDIWRWSRVWRMERRCILPYRMHFRFCRRQISIVFAIGLTFASYLVLEKLNTCYTQTRQMKSSVFCKSMLKFWSGSLYK